MYRVQTCTAFQDVPEEAKPSLPFQYGATPLFNRLKLVPREFAISETDFDATEQLLCNHCASRKRLSGVEAGTETVMPSKTASLRREKGALTSKLTSESTLQS